jgi:hypothetical protein
MQRDNLNKSIGQIFNVSDEDNNENQTINTVKNPVGKMDAQVARVARELYSDQIFLRFPNIQNFTQFLDGKTIHDLTRYAVLSASELCGVLNQVQQQRQQQDQPQTSYLKSASN